MLIYKTHKYYSILEKCLINIKSNGSSTLYHTCNYTHVDIHFLDFKSENEEPAV